MGNFQVSSEGLSKGLESKVLCQDQQASKSAGLDHRAMSMLSLMAEGASMVEVRHDKVQHDLGSVDAMPNSIVVRAFRTGTAKYWRVRTIVYRTLQCVFASLGDKDRRLIVFERVHGNIMEAMLGGMFYHNLW